MILRSQYPRFFAVLRKACDNQGIDGREAVDAYYRKICRECAGVDSIREIPSQVKFDACLARMSADAGEFQDAVFYDGERNKRTAYVIKTMAAQILQLSGLDESAARSYFDAILSQSRIGNGWHSETGSFYLDFSGRDLHTLLQILDSHLRRLKRRHRPGRPLTFSDRVRYSVDGTACITESVAPDYYANMAFGVTFRRSY